MAKKILNVEAGTVSFDFTKDGGEVFVVDAAKVPGYVTGLVGTALHGLLHGISQKVGDAYANAKNQPNPLEWAQKQVKETIAGIVGGVWNSGRSGDGATRVSLLARALHAVKLAAGQESTEAEAQAYVDGLSLDDAGNETKESIAAGKAKVAELKSKKKIAKAMAALALVDAQARLARAQKKAEGADADDEDEEDDEVTE